MLRKLVYRLVWQIVGQTCWGAAAKIFAQTGVANCDADLLGSCCENWCTGWCGKLLCRVVGKLLRKFLHRLMGQIAVQTCWEAAAKIFAQTGVANCWAELLGSCCENLCTDWCWKLLWKPVGKMLRKSLHRLVLEIALETCREDAAKIFAQAGVANCDADLLGSCCENLCTDWCCKLRCRPVGKLLRKSWHRVVGKRFSKIFCCVRAGVAFSNVVWKIFGLRWFPFVCHARQKIRKTF